VNKGGMTGIGEGIGNADGKARSPSDAKTARVGTGVVISAPELRLKYLPVKSECPPELAGILFD